MWPLQRYFVILVRILRSYKVRRARDRDHFEPMEQVEASMKTPNGKRFMLDFLASLGGESLGETHRPA